MFGQKSTVNTNARVTVYGFQNVSKDMFGLANFIIMESLQQKCYQNYQKGIATYIYIDEAHEFLGFEQAADYMQKLWRELRKVFGKTIVAIDNRIPKGTMTYDLINTDPDKHVK